MAVTDPVTVWHNPGCSKSRAALANLQARDTTPAVRLYLTDAPTAPELREMLTALGLPAATLLRKDAAALKAAPEDDIIAALVATPAWIERPLIRRGHRAVIGRTTEALDSLF